MVKLRIREADPGARGRQATRMLLRSLWVLLQKPQRSESGDLAQLNLQRFVVIFKQRWRRWHF